MRKGWEYKKLGEVCTLKAGYTPQKNELSDNGAYPYYKVADMNTLGNDVYLDITSSYKIDANKLFPKGAIVFPKNGAAVSTNKKRILKYDSIVDLNTGVAIFPKSINEKFAYYWFIDTDFKKYVRGGALPTLDIKSLKDKPFPSIDKSTQLAIVSELDKINELIRLKKEQLKDFDNLAQSLFYEMFGDPVENEKEWEVKKLGDCFSYIKNGANIKQTKDVDGFPITRIETLAGGIFNRDRMGYAGIYDLSKYSAYVLESRDLLMSHINSKTYIGRTVEYKRNNDETIIHGMNLLRLKAIHDIIDSTFFVYYTKSGDFKSKIARIRKDAVNQSSFAISDLKRLNIPLPPLSLQRLFAQRIEQIEREKSEVQKSIQDLETLLASRMQYWFE